MEKGIHKKQNLAWNRAWEKRFGDGSVIEADEVAFGQGKTLTEELLKAQVSFEVIPRGLVLREGKLVGVLAWLIKGKDVNLPSVIKEANSSMLFVSKEDFVQIYVASLAYNGSIVELYRYTPRVYPIYYRKKQIHYENTSFEDALQFKVEDFPVYVRDGAVFRRVKEGKYLADLWKDGFIDGVFSTFIFVYPDGTVHKEKHFLDTLYDRFLSGQLSCCLTGRSVVAFHRFEYRKFIESKEYQLISGRNRITGADCGVKVVENNGIHAGAVTLHDFFPNNGVCEAMDDIDFVDISEFSNGVRVLDLYACKHLRGVNVNLYKLDGFSLIYPNSENYRDENFRLDDCNQVSITGEVRATDVVVYASGFRSEELAVQMFPRELQSVVTDTLCLFTRVTGLKRLIIRSTEETVYDYSYRVTINLINMSLEELFIDFKQMQCVPTLYISACNSLKKVLVYCEGTVSLKNIFGVLSNKGLKEIKVACGQLEVCSRDIIKFERGEVKIDEDVSVKIEVDRVVWLAYSTESPRNRDVAAGLSALPESLRGIIVRRER